MLDRCCRSLRHLYELPTARNHVGALFRVPPASVRVSYAVEANGCLDLVAQLRRLGSGADVCALGELEMITAAGSALRTYSTSTLPGCCAVFPLAGTLNTRGSLLRRSSW